MSDVEKIVRDFYDNYGWEEINGMSGEDTLFRQFSRHYYTYHEHVNERTMKCFSNLTGTLLIAGGGDLPETHVKIAQKFCTVCCLDISKKSLTISRKKLGAKGEYVLGSILDIAKPDNCIDAVYCAHVIYHIDRQLQQKAVRELIRVTRPGGLVVIIYSNPRCLAAKIMKLKNKIPLIRKKKRKEKPTLRDTSEKPPLYFYAHPLEWWNQFHDECNIELIPWDVMGADQEKQLLVNDAIAWAVYRFCSWYEKRQASKAVRLWSYPLICLRKKPQG